jgi:hypothetical protein
MDATPGWPAAVRLNVRQLRNPFMRRQPDAMQAISRGAAVWETGRRGTLLHVLVGHIAQGGI